LTSGTNTSGYVFNLRGPHEKISDRSLLDCSCRWHQWMRWQSPGGKR
jgi:hypothetical protein